MIIYEWTISELMAEYKKHKEHSENAGSTRPLAFSALNKFSPKNYAHQKRFLSEMCDAYEFAVATSVTIDAVDSDRRHYCRIHGLESVGVFAERLRILSADMNGEFIEALFAERYENGEVARSKSEKVKAHYDKLMESANVRSAYEDIALPSLTVKLLTDTANIAFATMEQHGIDKNNIFDDTVEKVYDCFYERGGFVIDADIELTNLTADMQEYEDMDGENSYYDEDDVPMPDEALETQAFADFELVTTDIAGTMNPHFSSDDNAIHETGASCNAPLFNKAQKDYIKSMVSYGMATKDGIFLEAMSILTNQFSDYLYAAQSIDNCKDNDRYHALSMDLRYIDTLISDRVIPAVVHGVEELVNSGYNFAYKLVCTKNEAGIKIFKNGEQIFYLSALGVYKNNKTESQRTGSSLTEPRKVEWIVEDTITVFSDYSTISLNDFLIKYRNRNRTAM